MATVEHCLYCFETLSATLENRKPMSLYQVQASWATYPKGLDDDLSDEEEESTPEEPAKSSKPSNGSTPRIPVLQRLGGRSTSGSSTPSTSSSSLTPPSTTTTPDSNTPAFRPVGVSPRRTSQRSSTITSSPLFVTWNTVSPSTQARSLRGCIGTFEPQPLSSGLSSYTLISALQDHRFSPITASELPTLEVSVTLLTDFEDASEALDWELGVHGIRISFYARNKRFGACYLPDVPVEQGWDREETVVSLMRKAGWNGRRERWREVGDFKTTRFQGAAESVGWEEFKKWRAWVERGENKES